MVLTTAGGARIVVSKFLAVREISVMAKHRLVWYQNRNTPRVVTVGKSAKKKPSEGKVVKSRPATAAEEKQIAKGTWVRVDRNGKKPGQKGYGTGSKVRPQFNKPKSGK